MKRVLQLGVALAVAASSWLAAAATCNARVAVLASAGVKNKVNPKRAAQLLCSVGSQLGLDPGQTSMVLMQMLPDEGDIADVRPTTIIREIRNESRPGVVYLVCLVGESDDYKVAALLGSALADASGIHLTAAEFTAVLHRAIVADRSIVDKNALLEPRH